MIKPRYYARFLNEDGDQISAINIEILPRIDDEVRLSTNRWYKVLRVQIMYDMSEETLRVILRPGS